jgi:Uma2 family endonuclease
MPQATVTPEPLPEQFPHRRRFTRDEGRFLTDNGLLDGRWELVDGEIISKMGQNPAHKVAVILLNAYLTRVFDALRVMIQLPIDVAPTDNPINEPEPDGAVLARSAMEYPHGNPPPGDVLLVVEIADTSLRVDLTTKMARYARAGIADYWVIDLNGRRIVVHRAPAGDHYASVVSFGEDEMLAPLAAPSASVGAADLLPPFAMEE